MAFDYTKYRTKQIQEALLRKLQEKAKQKGPCSSLTQGLQDQTHRIFS